MKPSRITIAPDSLPWWRRFLRLRRPAAEIQADLDAAIRVANENANVADSLNRTVGFLGKKAGQLQHALAQRNVAWPKPEKRLSAQQVLGNVNVPMDHPLWTAVHQELDDAISDLCDRVGQPPPELGHEARIHVAGGIEHLRLFQKRLLDLNRQAGQADPEKAAGDDIDQ